MIALIITVIVMLILVGVTVNVALNGNLFDITTKATTDTKKEVERERLMEFVVASYNATEGKITDVDGLTKKIENSLSFKKDEDKTTDTKLVIQGENALWQINLNSLEVKEYVAKELPVEFNKKYVADDAEAVFIDTMEVKITMDKDVERHCFKWHV